MLKSFIKDFTKPEKDIIIKLNKLLKRLGNEPTYSVDESVSHAKYNDKENTITINNKTDFESIIHEQLHAILIFHYNFPLIEEIITMSKQYNLLRLKHLIINIYNDFHHFVFFLEYSRIAKNKTITINEKQLLHPKFKFNFLKQKFITTQNTLDKVKMFYTDLYIPYKYKILTNKGAIEWNTDSLSELDNELFQIFNTLFNFKIDFSIENKADYYTIVIDSFSNYFQSMNDYLSTRQLLKKRTANTVYKKLLVLANTNHIQKVSDLKK